jgi:hypothetical protein
MTERYYAPPTRFERTYLKDFDVLEQGIRAHFLEVLYQHSGRANPKHPQHGLFINLWQNFCLYEAGNFARNHYYERERAKQETINEIKRRDAENMAADGGATDGSPV